MHEISDLPVDGRADNAAVYVSERRNPVISSRIVILSQRVPRLVACVRRAALIVGENIVEKLSTIGIRALIVQYASCRGRIALVARKSCTHCERQYPVKKCSY
jgi:hypothetical protein